MLYNICCMFLNLSSALKTLLAVQIAIASAKWFLQFGVKSYLRTSMPPERLRNLALLNRAEIL